MKENANYYTSEKIVYLGLRESVATMSSLDITNDALDHALTSHFKTQSHRYGKRDRWLIRDIIYGFIRNRLLVEKWTSFLTHNQVIDNQQLLSFLICLIIEKKITLELLAGLFQEHMTQSIIAKELQENIVQYFSALSEHELPPGEHSLSPAQKLSLQYSFPQWLVEKWIDRCGQKKAEKLCQFMNKRAPLQIRTNTHIIPQTDLLKIFQKKGYRASLCKYSPSGITINDDVSLYITEEYKKGYFEVQDEGSQIISYLVNPRKDAVMWDACAGAGGKTLHLSILLHNSGTIFATDIDTTKISELRIRAQRAKASNILTGIIPREAEDNEQLFTVPLDTIILDAPCSGTGRLRRNPEVTWKLTPETIVTFAQQNYRLLERYCSYLKKDGSLFYITCSLEKEENEGVVERFLEAHKNFVRGEFTYNPACKIKTDTAFFRIDPLEFDTDGFFIAVLRRVE
jgi:16S rRNA (cytosine967-C5)-methyltransferase